jgi:hypothetical protein
LSGKLCTIQPTCAAKNDGHGLGCRRTAPSQPPKRDAERAAGELDEARLQLGVLLETVEALQAGSLEEREQAVVSMATQLCAARAREAALERRASDLLVRWF